MTEPKAINDLIGNPTLHALRITGKAVEEWDRIFQERRRRGRETGHFRGGVMLLEMSEAQRMKAGPSTTGEVDAYCRKYGLSGDDIICVSRVPVWTVVENRKRAHLSFPSIPIHKGEDAKTLIVQMVNPERHPR